MFPSVRCEEDTATATRPPGMADVRVTVADVRGTPSTEGRLFELFRDDSRRLSRARKRAVRESAHRQGCEAAAQELSLPRTLPSQPRTVLSGLGMTRQVEQPRGLPRHAPHQSTTI